MRLKIVITKKDFVVVLACLTFLVINIGAISSGGRRRAKRILCLTNLKQLTLAWTQYADDNEGKIVNGAPLGTECQADPGPGNHPGEIPWVGRDWSYYINGQREECQKSAIRAGALWPYCQELKLYHCPTGVRYDIRSYAIVDGMNGLQRAGTIAGVHWIKNITQIINPGERAVFIDQGWVTPDSYAVYFDRALWWEQPPVRHSDGTNLSFADGHSEYWRWKGTDTIAYGSNPYPISNVPPTTPEGMEDLQRLQVAVWGALGYTPP